MKNLKKLCLIVLFTTVYYNADAQTETTWYTSMGSFKVVLTDTLTPRTVDSFIARVAEKFYDGQIFHRVINNFMIQGGDPLGTGFGGPGYSFPDEFKPTLKNIPGALSMANSGPNTNGSQFFINLITNSHLDNKHTVFGKVTLNFVIVQNIGAVPTSATDKPITDVRLDSIRITNLPPASIVYTGTRLAATIYPNPARGIVNIDLPDRSTNVTIVNTLGQSIYATEAKGALKVDLRNIPAGLYLVRLSTVNGFAESKLVVQ
ncbi:MAG: peptidylprolyl isomerase [Taibaiella sp.]|nr:peptidylprolyl isomerase [Taibaiella sp.]